MSPLRFDLVTKRRRCLKRSASPVSQRDVQTWASPREVTPTQTTKTDSTRLCCWGPLGTSCSGVIGRLGHYRPEHRRLLSLKTVPQFSAPTAPALLRFISLFVVALGNNRTLSSLRAVSL